MKLKKSTLFKFLALSSLGLYLYYRKSEGEKDGKMEGIDLTINPELLVDSTISSIPMHPLKKEVLRQSAKKVVRGVMNKGEEYEEDY